jgi:transcription-repair coupling factor (superfamily II helicase)
MGRLKVEAARSGFEAISARDNEFVLTVRRTIGHNRIVLYRRFRNEARVQQSVIRIPRRLLGANWMEQLRELLPAS